MPMLTRAEKIASVLQLSFAEFRELWRSGALKALQTWEVQQLSMLLDADAKSKKDLSEEIAAKA